jgi:hypothetical protein
MWIIPRGYPGYQFIGNHLNSKYVKFRWLGWDIILFDEYEYKYIILYIRLTLSTNIVNNNYNIALRHGQFLYSYLIAFYKDIFFTYI